MSVSLVVFRLEIATEKPDIQDLCYNGRYFPFPFAKALALLGSDRSHVLLSCGFSIVIMSVRVIVENM